MFSSRLAPCATSRPRLAFARDLINNYCYYESRNNLLLDAVKRGRAATAAAESSQTCFASIEKEESHFGLIYGESHSLGSTLMRLGCLIVWCIADLNHHFDIIKRR